MTTTLPWFWTITSTAFGLATVVAWGLATALAFHRRDTMPRTWLFLGGGFVVVFLRLVAGLVSSLTYSLVPWSATLAMITGISSGLASLLVTGLALVAVFVDRAPEPDVSA